MGADNNMQGERESPGADDLFDAIAFATRAHRNQYRKGTRIPYIVHPLSVAEILINLGEERDVVMAGLLHDVIEDAENTVGDIRERFGDRVAVLVSEVTEQDKSQPWKTRKENAIRRLRVADTDALVIACADKLHNMRTLNEQLSLHPGGYWDSFNASQEELYWYYRTLASVFCEAFSVVRRCRIAEDYACLVEGNFQP